MCTLDCSYFSCKGFLVTCQKFLAFYQRFVKILNVQMYSYVYTGMIANIDNW